MNRLFDPALLVAAGAAQRAALQPQQQVWISANAGTGKTEVLTRRLVALLLGDPTCAPGQILALTFTKAGAAEMAARLPRKLVALQALDDAALAQEMATALGLTFNEHSRERLASVLLQMARQPVVIRTLHGFAGDLLRRFANEAEVLGIARDYTLLDEAAAKRLLREAQVRALSRTEGVQREAVDLLLAELGEYGWQELTRLTTGQWPKFNDVLTRAGDEATLVAQLAASLGLDEGATPLPLPVPDQAFWRRLQPVKPVQTAWENVLALLGNAAAPELPGRLEKFWCTEAGTLRKQFMPKALLEKDPALAGELDEAGETFMAWLRDRAARQTLELTAALLGWGASVQAEYAGLKRAAGVVDYQDLLDTAETLLAEPEVIGALGKKFRHLVVDEAQDNNAQQARLVQRLADSLLAAGQSDEPVRTVLAVGDMKQSIYRFQGAQPMYFQDLRTRLQDVAMPLADGRAGMVEVNLAHSFRSSAVVLQLVDAVFDGTPLAGVVTGEPTNAWPIHRSVAPARAGRVEIWPLVPRAIKAEIAPWTLPMDRAVQDAKQREQDGLTVCARQLAARLRHEIDAGVVVPSTGQALRPRDVLVLTQRNSVADTFRQVLRAHGLPVAGSRLTVADPVLQDLLALLRVLQNPLDRLSIAVVLKSPLAKALGGEVWDDGRLFGLLHAGPDTWGELARYDAGLHVALVRWREQAGLMAPAGLVMQVWRELDIPARYARQPNGMVDLVAAGEFLAELAAQDTTLAELLVRLEDEDFVLELGDAGEDAVRVLTTFKAKGLEAPLVVLADTTQPLADLSKDRLSWIEFERQWRGVIYRLGGVAKELPLRIRLDDEEQQRQRADRLRQLYVALTRARDWLWVTGWEGLRADETWYGLIGAGLARLAGVSEEGDRKVLAQGGLTYAPVAPTQSALPPPVPQIRRAALAQLLWEDPTAPLTLLAPVAADDIG